MIFHMHVKSCHVKDKWKECEKLCEKCYPFHTVISHTLQTSSHTRLGSKHVKKHVKYCVKGIYFHTLFTYISHSFHMIISHSCEILRCEKDVKSMWKFWIVLPFHMVFHMLCQTCSCPVIIIFVGRIHTHFTCLPCEKNVKSMWKC